MDSESIPVMVVAHTIVLAAFIKTHPQPVAFHLALTSLLEQQLAGGALVAGLTDAEKGALRDAVESLQGIRSVHSPDPRTPPAPR